MKFHVILYTFLILIAGTLWCLSLNAQTIVVFDSNGRLIGRNPAQSTSKSKEKHKRPERIKKVKFDVADNHQSDKDKYLYFITYRFSDQSHYNPPLVNYEKYVFHKKDMKALRVPKRRAFMNYHLYRMPAMDLDIYYCGDFQDLLETVTRKENKTLKEKRQDLKNRVGKLTNAQKKKLLHAQSMFERNLRMLKEKQRKLKFIVQNPRRPDERARALLNSFGVEEAFYKAQIKVYTDHFKQITKNVGESEQNTSGAIAAKLKELHESLETIMMEATKLELEREAARLQEIEDMNDEIENLTLAISDISTDTDVESIIKDKYRLSSGIRINSDLELLHTGSIALDKEIKFVQYDVRANDNEIYELSRVYGKTPLLSELDYLGIEVLNIPAKHLSGRSPLRVEVSVDKTTTVTDRFDGVRSVDSFDLAALFSQPSAEEESDKRETESYSPKKTDSLANGEDQKIQDYLDEIGKAGSIKLNIITDQAYIDYYYINSTRFNAGWSPGIVINMPKEGGQVSVKTGSGSSGNTANATGRKLVDDKLEPVEKLFRFGISTGVTASVVRNYRYFTQPIDGTLEERLIEEKFNDYEIKPAVFLSYYIHPQQINLRPRFFHSTSFNLGVGFKNPLENVFAGVGFEPVRHLQVQGGVKFAKIKKLNRDSFDPFNVDFRDDLRSTWRVGGYIGVNFYLNAVQEFITRIF